MHLYHPIFKFLLEQNFQILEKNHRCLFQSLLTLKLTFCIHKRSQCVTWHYNILSCKTVDSDWLRDSWQKSISPAELWNHALTHDRTWQRVILLDDGWYSKKYRLRIIYARTVHHEWWAFQFMEYKIQTQIFTWSGLFWNQT